MSSTERSWRSGGVPFVHGPPTGSTSAADRRSTAPTPAGSGRTAGDATIAHDWRRRRSILPSALRSGCAGTRSAPNATSCHSSSTPACVKSRCAVCWRGRHATDAGGTTTSSATPRVGHAGRASDSSRSRTTRSTRRGLHRLGCGTGTELADGSQIDDAIGGAGDEVVVRGDQHCTPAVGGTP